MKIKQAKLAQPLRGDTSSIISSDRYDMIFEKGMLHAALKVNPRGIGPFVVFPANVAYMEPIIDEETVKITDSQPIASQAENQPIKPKGRPKKGE